jgi:hypothetical protein
MVAFIGREDEQSVGLINSFGLEVGKELAERRIIIGELFYIGASPRQKVHSSLRLEPS